MNDDFSKETNPLQWPDGWPANCLARFTMADPV